MSALFGTPPPYSGGLGRATLLGDVAQKPRSRSEWEQRFATWRQPASRTETEKSARANSSVRAALANSDFLRTREWKILSQGSYYNDTNVRADSDIDICVALMDTTWWELPPGEREVPDRMGGQPTITHPAYKQKIIECLSAHFTRGRVHPGDKAITIDKEVDGRISIDVVPAFSHGLYGATNPFTGVRPLLATGVALFMPDGTVKTNFPEQHYANGCIKNARTSRRYKRVVRILKTLRNHMQANTGVSAETKQIADCAKSFLLESLVYNCPDQCFGNASLYDDVVGVLRFISVNLTPPGGLSSALALVRQQGWMEVNGIKPLFRADQAWTADDAYRFATASLAYMGL